MTHDNSPAKFTDAAASGSKHGPEPESEQARFMAKMRESVLGGFNTSVNREREKPQREPNIAVKEILNGFVLEDDSKKAAT